jgi:hypothetical protein
LPFNRTKPEGNKNMKKGICSILLSVFVMLHLEAIAVESKSQGTLQALVTFQDGVVVQVSEPQFVYRWILGTDTRYINPPVNEERSKNLWTQETSHGMTVQREVQTNEIEAMEIELGSSGDTCGLKPVVLLQGGVKITEPQVNAVPREVAKRSDDATFHSVGLVGVVRNGKEAHKFSIRLWGAGICPEVKDVVKHITFTGGP